MVDEATLEQIGKLRDETQNGLRELREALQEGFAELRKAMLDENQVQDTFNLELDRRVSRTETILTFVGTLIVVAISAIGLLTACTDNITVTLNTTPTPAPIVATAPPPTDSPTPTIYQPATVTVDPTPTLAPTFTPPTDIPPTPTPTGDTAPPDAIWVTPIGGEPDEVYYWVIVVVPDGLSVRADHDVSAGKLATLPEGEKVLAVRIWTPEDYSEQWAELSSGRGWVALYHPLCPQWNQHICAVTEAINKEEN